MTEASNLQLVVWRELQVYWPKKRARFAVLCRDVEARETADILREMGCEIDHSRDVPSYVASD